MGCFKFDKLDKIVIALTFILVTIFSIFNCFCFASENIDLEYYYNIIADDTTNTFVSSSDGSCIGFFAEKGYRYTIKAVDDFSFSRIIVSSSSEPAIGVSLDVLFITLLNSGDYFSYSANEDVYITISKNVASNKLVVERELLSGLDKTIEKLVDNVGLQSLWSVFNTSVPYVLVVVVVAFGIYLIFRMIKGLSKGKGRL